MFSAVLAPATICLMVAGSISFMLDLDGGLALVLSVVPPAVYLFLCFKLKTDTQITIAAVLSVIYAFLMLVVSMAIVGAMVKDRTIFTPSSMFVIGMAAIYLVTALMHPQEFNLVFYGFLYIICIPSAYLLLTIYSMVNLNNVSWGTRETKPAPGTAAAGPAPAAPPTHSDRARSLLRSCSSWIRCCKKSSPSPEKTQAPQAPQELQELQEPGPQNTIVDGLSNDDFPREETVYDYPHQCWVSEMQQLSSEMKLEEERLEKEEEEFFKELQVKYLAPLPVDKAQQEKVKEALKELRNKINFAFFMVNALWLVATFTLQAFDVAIFIEIPKVSLELEDLGQLRIDPIGFMFIIGFAASVLIQFLAMLLHRVNTLIHYVAFLNTEPRSENRTGDLYQPHKKVSAAPSVESQSDYSSASVSDARSQTVDSDEDEDEDEEVWPGVSVRRRSTESRV